jgi:predicted HNH restriction endonuclease
LREIKKCELVCANCHRIRTRRRAQWANNQRS